MVDLSVDFWRVDGSVLRHDIEWNTRIPSGPCCVKLILRGNGGQMKSSEMKEDNESGTD